MRAYLKGRPMNDTPAIPDKSCSISNCPLPATATEVGESEHWRFTVYYCHEHARETGQGTPLGPVGIDATRVEVSARGNEDPVKAGHVQATSPH